MNPFEEYHKKKIDVFPEKEISYSAQFMEYAKLKGATQEIQTENHRLDELEQKLRIKEFLSFSQGWIAACAFQQIPRLEPAMEFGVHCKDLLRKVFQFDERREELNRSLLKNFEQRWRRYIFQVSQELSSPPSSFEDLHKVFSTALFRSFNSLKVAPTLTQQDYDNIWHYLVYSEQSILSLKEKKYFQTAFKISGNVPIYDVAPEMGMSEEQLRIFREKLIVKLRASGVFREYVYQQFPLLGENIASERSQYDDD